MQRWYGLALAAETPGSSWTGYNDDCCRRGSAVSVFVHLTSGAAEAEEEGGRSVKGPHCCRQAREWEACAAVVEETTFVAVAELLLLLLLSQLLQQTAADVVAAAQATSAANANAFPCLLTPFFVSSWSAAAAAAGYQATAAAVATAAAGPAPAEIPPAVCTLCTLSSSSFARTSSSSSNRNSSSSSSSSPWRLGPFTRPLLSNPRPPDLDPNPEAPAEPRSPQSVFGQPR
ncbi:hypothetical protein Esti_003433 [Eimeria stiedai]